jgi:hypothetical protein
MEASILEKYIAKEVMLIWMSFPSYCNCALHHSSFYNLPYLPPNKIIWKRKKFSQCNFELLQFFIGRFLPSLLRIQVDRTMVQSPSRFYIASMWNLKALTITEQKYLGKNLTTCLREVQLENVSSWRNETILSCSHIYELLKPHEVSIK